MQPLLDNPSRLQSEVTPESARPEKSSPAKSSGGDLKMSVVVVTNKSQLIEYLADWEDLAANAIEPNVFYESWFLVPALTRLDQNKTIEFVLIFGVSNNEPQSRKLCGLFPLERDGRYKGIPVSVLKLWRHIHCFLCTPLVRAEHARECLSSFFEWLSSSQGSGVMEWSFIPDAGPFHQLLVDQINDSVKLSYVVECFNRALLTSKSDGEQYIDEALSTKHRKSLKRLESRLAERGQLKYETLGPADNAGNWIEDFLRLEAAGWKGREGSALASNDAEREFFLDVAREAARRGRLGMVSARLDGKLIAIRSHFIASSQAFTFKIAFDEEFSQFSPGMLLELENIRQFHNHAELRWMDSCTVTDNFMFNRLWLDRRTISTVLVSTGRWSGDLCVSLFPVLRLINRRFLPRRPSS